MEVRLGKTRENFLARAFSSTKSILNHSKSTPSLQNG